MPIKVSKSLSAIAFLEKENIFVMSDERALSQEIRPLKIAVLNLMPNKIATETQILRMLSNSPLQIEVIFLRTATYNSKNTAEEYLNSFYFTFEDITSKKMKFDALIITGAPVEKLDFVEVAYWDELRFIMDWAKHNVYSSMYICWAAQAAMYYHYGINKFTMDNKISGIFSHTVLDICNPLMRGFDDVFNAPHSRYTQIDSEKLFSHPELDVLATSSEAGVYLAASKDLRRVFVFGHGEYDKDTLHNECVRDANKGLNIVPKNYYIDQKNGEVLPITWRAHESLLMSNWLNYCVYQATPFDMEKIK